MQHAATPPTGATHMPLPACFAGKEEGGGGGTSLAQDKISSIVKSDYSDASAVAYSLYRPARCNYTWKD